MASKQTRRSISVRGTTYSHLRDFCAAHDRSMSDVVEELLSRILESNTAAAPRGKTVAPLMARAPERNDRSEKPLARTADRIAERIAERVAVKAPTPVAEVPEVRAAAAAPAARAEELRVVRSAPVRAVPPVKPGPARPVPVASAGRPAPTPASKVLKGTQRSGGDYRAIRF